MPKPKDFKTITSDKYSSDDVAAIESLSPAQKRPIRAVLSVSVTQEVRTWLEELIGHLNRHCKRKITKSEVTFLALLQLKEKSYDLILKELRQL